MLRILDDTGHRPPDCRDSVADSNRHRRGYSQTVFRIPAGTVGEGVWRACLDPSLAACHFYTSSARFPVAFDAMGALGTIGRKEGFNIDRLGHPSSHEEANKFRAWEAAEQHLFDCPEVRTSRENVIEYENELRFR
jgi:hypothetical protein